MTDDELRALAERLDQWHAGNAVGVSIDRHISDCASAASAILSLMEERARAIDALRNALAYIEGDTYGPTTEARIIEAARSVITDLGG